MSEWTREEAIKEVVARGIEWAKCAKELKECKEALRKRTGDIFKRFDELLDDSGCVELTAKWCEKYDNFKEEMGVL